MSGGSMDYLCYKLDEYADFFKDREIVELVKDLSKVAHDCEWCIDGDIGPGTYKKTLVEFKEKWFNSSREERLKGLIEDIINKAKEECFTLIGVENFCKDCESFIVDDKSDYGNCKFKTSCLMHKYENCENFSPKGE